MSNSPSAFDVANQLTQLLTYKIVRIGRIMERSTARLAKLEGLSINEFKVLILVARLHRCAITQAIQNTTIDQGNTSKSVDSLLDRGLLQKIEDPEDHRKRLLELTPEGEAIVARAFPFRIELEKQILSRFSESERQQLDTLLSTILNIVNKPHYIDEVEILYENSNFSPR